MTCNARMAAFGGWSLNLSEDTPAELLELLTQQMLGTIMITDSAINISEIDPLDLSRFTGVLRAYEFTQATKQIGGSSNVWFLGDQQSRGPINKTVQSFNAASFTAAVTAVLPPSITPGNIIPEVGAFSGSFLLKTARARLQYICSAFDAEYVVTPQNTLDAGTPASLFPTFNDPIMFIRRGASGVDPEFKHLPLASASMGADLVDFATNSLLVAEQDGLPVIVADEELSPPSAKRAPNGSLLDIQDIIVESSTTGANAPARALARLAQISETRTSVKLSTADYDVFGTMEVGDSVYVWDPEAGFYDLANEIQFRGETFFPLKLRVMGLTWPVTEGMGCYFAEPTLTATLHDLTPYVIWEAGSTECEVGSAARSLIPGPTEPLGPIVAPIVNPSTTPPPIPDAPAVAGNVLYVQVISDLGTGGVDFTMPLDLDHLEVHISTSSGFTPDATSYVGDIPANRAHIEAQASVIRTFEAPTTTTRYVRIIAVNGSGLKSPASTQVSVVATLIDTANITNLAVTDAKIGSMSVAKLTAGDITAAIITITASGKFRFGRTSAPFHHGYIDANGIYGFTAGSAPYTGGLAQLAWNIAAGTFTLQGATINAGQINGTDIVSDLFRTSSVSSASRIQIGTSPIVAGIKTLSFFFGGDGEAGADIYAFTIGSGPSLRTAMAMSAGRLEVSGSLQPTSSIPSLFLSGRNLDATANTERIALGFGGSVSDGIEIYPNRIKLFHELFMQNQPVYMCLDGDLRHRIGYVGGFDGVEVQGVGGVELKSYTASTEWTRLKVDNGGGGGNTHTEIDDGTVGLRRISVGANDSGGAGFRVLRIPN